MRSYTNKLWNLIDQDILDTEYVLKVVLNWMSEQEVEEMCLNSDLADEFDEDTCNTEL